MTANFIDPETPHRPFGYTHVVEVRRLAVGGRLIEVEAVAIVQDGDPDR